MRQQKGLYIQGERVTDPLKTISEDTPEDGIILLRKGKKRYHRVRIID